MSPATIPRHTIERFRESAFVALALLGAAVLAFGGAFLTIGLAINTAPPAPYVTPTDKQLLIVGSLLSMVVGGLLIRAAARMVGW
ncbi:MAG: hypothetical protein ABEH59_04430 [Halobacteriales archaeon]